MFTLGVELFVCLDLSTIMDSFLCTSITCSTFLIDLVLVGTVRASPKVMLVFTNNHSCVTPTIYSATVLSDY